MISDHPLWYPAREFNSDLEVRSFASYTLNEPGINWSGYSELNGDHLFPEQGGESLPHTPIKMVRNKRVERFPLLSRSRRPPLPQFLIGQRPPNRTASTSIRGSEATTTPVTDKTLWWTRTDLNRHRARLQHAALHWSYESESLWWRWRESNPRFLVAGQMCFR